MSNKTSGKFSIEVTSVPDRPGLVAEVWSGEELLAELRHEDSRLRVQVYPAPNRQSWDFTYEEFTVALQQARDKLGPANERANG
ncbi:MAG TPA: hypothetical protein DCQ33_16080 [Nitrospira sp.]|nr:hypothetical protein [Nitrospira sp.]